MTPCLVWGSLGGSELHVVGLDWSPHRPGECSARLLRPLTDVLSGPPSVCEQHRSCGCYSVFPEV